MLAILTTHPIQYQVPLWQALARSGEIPFEVWYLSDHGVRAAADREFGRSFAWDLPLLEGYPHRFLRVNAGAAVDAPPHALRLVESLAVRLRAQGITHLWVHGWHKAAMWQAVAAARRAGVRVWLRGESNDLATTPAWKRPLKQAMLRRLFNRVDAFLCIGSANRRFYSSYGVPDSRLHWTPYGVHHERFAAAAADLHQARAEIRREWQIPDEAFCVLFCGKFVPKKRPFDLIAAVGDIALPPVHLLFVGSGELGAAMRASTQVVFDADAGGRVGPNYCVMNSRPAATFAGFLNQTEISRAYVAADCLVLPSDAGETWGLVVNEALASGLPCVVSDVVGCGEDLVAPLNASWRFRLGDTAALARSLTSVGRDAPSAAAVRKHVEAFGFETTIRTVGALFRADVPAVAGATLEMVR